MPGAMQMQCGMHMPDALHERTDGLTYAEGGYERRNLAVSIAREEQQDRSQLGNPNCRARDEQCDVGRKIVHGLCMWHYLHEQDLGLAQTDLVGIGEAAKILGSSTDILRSREREGVIESVRTPGGHRRYRRSDLERLVSAGVADARPPGKPTERVIGERMLLTADDERECMRIAEAAATLWVQKIPALDWDSAFSDAMYGVAVALSRPSPDVPWNVSCWNHAQWEVIKGIRKASGISNRAYSQGVRSESLPEDRKPPVSLDAALELTNGLPDQTTGDEYDLLLSRVLLEDRIGRLSRSQRIALVNAIGHQFTDREIAEGLGVKPSEVADIRAGALYAIRSRDRVRLAIYWGK